MNWLFPGFLAAGLAIGLPVLLHFLRSRPKTIVHFPSLRLLGETAIRDTRKHRLRRLLTLLLRCLVIALLAAAFARPFWINRSTAHRHVLLIAMDNSMSMQATGRWETLREQALAQLSQLQTGDEAALLLMHPNPTWLVPFTEDLVHVRSALMNAQPGFEKTRYAPALQMAAETLSATPGGDRTIFWMADEQQTGWAGMDFAKTLPAGINLVFAAPSEAPQHQAAITSLSWAEAEKRDRVKVTVRLFAPLRDERTLTIFANGKPIASQSVSLQAGDNTFELAAKDDPSIRGLRVAMNADDLPADDAAWISSEKPATASVLLDQSAGPDFLAHALRSTSVLADGGFQPAPLPEKEWPKGAVAILRGDQTFQKTAIEVLENFVNAGGAAWIFADGGAEQTAWLAKHGVTVTERLPSEDAEHLRDWDPDHPALAAFAGQSLMPLLNVEFYQGFDLGGDALTPLANWPDGKIALAEWTYGGHRILLAGFPPTREATNWPTQASFVPFVHQAIRWLGSFSSVHDSFRVGEVIPLHAQGKWHALDTSVPMKDLDVNGSVRPSAPGLYEFVSAGKSQTFAVNIPEGESDLTPWPNPAQLAQLQSSQRTDAAQNHAATISLSDELSENQQRLWWWVLAICGVAILAELLLANRTAL